MLKKMKDFRFWMVLPAFLVTVGILFGGQKLATMFRAENPTRRQVTAIKAVRQFSVNRNSDGLTVELKLDKVGNLETILDSVKQKVETNYNQPVRNFKISGRSDSKLRRIRYNLSFYLEEALVSGRYIQLKRALDGYQPVKARVYLGPEFIYIQLENDNHYLYEAIPRGTKVLATNNNQGGDSV